MKNTPLWTGLAVTALLAACGDKGQTETTSTVTDIYENGPGEGEGEGEGTATCDGTWSVVTGTVTGPYTSDPNPDARVYAWADALPEPVEAVTDADGVYSLTVPPMTLYIEAYTYEGCWSISTEVTTEECETSTVDIEIRDCDIADKPNLYVYPEADTPMTVRIDLDPRQRIVAAIPDYPKRGWQGIAHVDGTWTPRGMLEREPFLFYEVSLVPWQSRSLQREVGWCIPVGGEAAVSIMAELLGEYGFNAAEREDFVEGWIHDLPPADSYAVYPQLDVEPMAHIVMSPALPVDRVWFVVDDGAGCHPMWAPEVVPFDRTGGHAVEWGVILGDLVR